MVLRAVIQCVWAITIRHFKLENPGMGKGQKGMKQQPIEGFNSRIQVYLSDLHKKGMG